MYELGLKQKEYTLPYSTCEPLSSQKPNNNFSFNVRVDVKSNLGLQVQLDANLQTLFSLVSLADPGNGTIAESGKPAAGGTKCLGEVLGAVVALLVLVVVLVAVLAAALAAAADGRVFGEDRVRGAATVSARISLVRRAGKIP